MTVSTPFLIVDDRPISLEKALSYLQIDEKFQPFLKEILFQYIIEKELQVRPNLEVDEAKVEQAIVNFRLRSQLVESERFQDWLTDNGRDYSTFRSQIYADLKLQKLKAQIVDPKLRDYFLDRQIFLDRVVISRIVVESRELAEELKSQILETV
jgi:hypothetical protein